MEFSRTDRPLFSIQQHQHLDSISPSSSRSYLLSITAIGIKELEFLEKSLNQETATL